MTLGDSIREARLKKGFSLAEVAAQLGVSTSYIGHLEKGTRSVTPELKVSLMNVLGPLVEHSVEVGKVTRDMPVEQDLTIPLHWQSVPAGDMAPIVSDSYDEFNVTKRYANSFAVYIRGDSLIEAGIEDSDIAVFRENVPPRDGQVVFACVNNMCTVKVYTRDKNGRVVLYPANKKYTPIPVTNDDELTIRGVLINVVREVKPYKPE